MPASPTSANSEDVSQLQQELAELRAKLDSVDEAASASDVAEMRRRLDKISMPGVSVVGEGGHKAQAMLPAHEQGSNSTTGEMQQLKRELAELQAQVQILTMTEAGRQEEAGAGEGAVSGARTQQDEEDLNALLR